MAKAGQSWSSKEHAAHKAAHGPSGIEHGKYSHGTEHHGLGGEARMMFRETKISPEHRAQAMKRIEEVASQWRNRKEK
jgi:hypothetical protein